MGIGSDKLACAMAPEAKRVESYDAFAFTNDVTSGRAGRLVG
jgi:hypothetical protein